MSQLTMLLESACHFVIVYFGMLCINLACYVVLTSFLCGCCPTQLLLLHAQVDDAMELKAIETQINEFGQTPKQLFAHPHPPRLVSPPAPDPSKVFDTALTGSSSSTSLNMPHSSSFGSNAGLPAGASAAAPSRAARGLKAGGDDGRGRALAVALLTTIMAAAAPEIQQEAAAAREPMTEQQQRQQHHRQQQQQPHGSGVNQTLSLKSSTNVKFTLPSTTSLSISGKPAGSVPQPSVSNGAAFALSSLSNNNNSSASDHSTGPATTSSSSMMQSGGMSPVADTDHMQQLMEAARLSPVSQQDARSASPVQPSYMTDSSSRVSPDANLLDAGGPEGRLSKLKGYMSRLSEGAASASSALRTRLSSSNLDSPGRMSDSAASSTGQADPVPHHDSSAKAAPYGLSMSLAWMQSQFARGLGSAPAAPSSSLSSQTAVAAAAASNYTDANANQTSVNIMPQFSGVRDASQVAASSGRMGTTAVQQPGTSSSVRHSTTGRAAAAAAPIAGSSTPPPLASPSWPQGLPDRMLICKSVRLHREPITAVAISQVIDWGALSSHTNNDHHTQYTEMPHTCVVCNPALECIV